MTVKTIAYVAVFAALFASVSAIAQSTQPVIGATGAASQKSVGDDKAKIEMVFVKGGTFMMGCTREQWSDCYDDENPAHSVTVSDFYIGKYEVTQNQWVQVMGSDNNPSFFKGGNLPAENVSWNDVQTFIQALNCKATRTDGMKYRLPTEAEWEYAARGGQSSQEYKYSGSNNIDDVAWYYNNSSNRTQPNELGIYDMSGNVFEWVNDWYGDYSSSSPTESPQGPSSGSYRVSRGGGWNCGAKFCRVSYRDGHYPDYKTGSIGFRLVLSP